MLGDIVPLVFAAAKSVVDPRTSSTTQPMLYRKLYRHLYYKNPRLSRSRATKEDLESIWFFVKGLRHSALLFMWLVSMSIYRFDKDYIEQDLLDNFPAQALGELHALHTDVAGTEEVLVYFTPDVVKTTFKPNIKERDNFDLPLPAALRVFHRLNLACIAEWGRNRRRYKGPPS